MCRDMDVEISARIRSAWNAFSPIKDVLKAKLDYSPRANILYRTVLPEKLYKSEI